MPKPARTEPGQSVSPGAHRSPTVRVWDPIVRLFHWSLVLSIAVAWVTDHTWQSLHEFAGYAAAALITTRLLWGVVGTPYARFSQFVRHPTVIVDYLRAMLDRREARYIGHNPAGGAMVVAILLATAATAVTGWMTTTNAYFGVDWVQQLHELCAHGLLLLVFVHVGGVILASYRHRENLVAAMVSGRKRSAEANDRA